MFLAYLASLCSRKVCCIWKTILFMCLVPVTSNVAYTCAFIPSISPWNIQHIWHIYLIGGNIYFWDPVGNNQLIVFWNVYKNVWSIYAFCMLTVWAIFTIWQSCSWLIWLIGLLSICNWAVVSLSSSCVYSNSNYIIDTCGICFSILPP